MTAKETSDIFYKISKILEVFSDKPLPECLDNIYEIVINNSKVGKKKVKILETTETGDIEISDELIKEMTTYEKDELTNFLENNPLFKTKSGLIKLANILSITGASRSNYQKLIYLIFKHFERLRMDTIIRNERNSIIEPSTISKKD